MFTIKIKRKALRNLEGIDSAKRQKLKSVIMLLKDDPIPFKKTDVIKLRGCSNSYRIRVGDIRITYEVLWNEKTILIHYVGLRNKAYD